MFKKGVWGIKRPPGQTLSPETLLWEAGGGPWLQGDCDRCGECIRACPSNSISIAVTAEFDLGSCLHCMDCVAACPKGSLRPDGKLLVASERESLHDDGDPAELEALHQTVKSLFGRSLAIRVVDAGACNACISEVSALSNPIYDLERFGVKVVASPRHADMLLVCGPVTENMLQGLTRSWEAMPEPKLLVAMGACAISGGAFRNSERAHGGLDKILPVDAYIPGCPPNASRLAAVLRHLVEGPLSEPR